MNATRHDIALVRPHEAARAKRDRSEQSPMGDDRAKLLRSLAIDRGEAEPSPPAERPWSKLLASGAVAICRAGRWFLVSAPSFWVGGRAEQARLVAARPHGWPKRHTPAAEPRAGRRPQRFRLRRGAAQGDGGGGDHGQGGRAVRRRGHGGAGRPGRRAAGQRARGDRPHAGAVEGRRRRGRRNRDRRRPAGRRAHPGPGRRACRRRALPARPT